MLPLNGVPRLVAGTVFVLILVLPTATLFDPGKQAALAAQDLTKPAVRIAAPSNGATVQAANSIGVKGSASDSGSGVKNVWARIDSGLYYAATPQAPNDWSTWSVQLKISTGQHTITARARDNSGNTKWTSISVTVQDGSATPGDTIPAALRTVPVSTIDGLMTSLAGAKAGDHIVLKDGVYDDTNWLNSKSAKNLLVKGIDGTDANPIVVTPETVGGAELRGSGGLRFYDVSHLIVRGFRFTHSQDNAGFSGDVAIQCDQCHYVRFTRNSFELTTLGSAMADWLGITSDQSDHNRIDHNSFMNKKTAGVFTLIFGKYTAIDHNYFYNQSYSGGNGGECMRIGNSALGLVDYFTTVEYNLFEHCDGDMEAVTVKSSSNIIRANTFRGNEGSLTFRHGNNNVADGNFFLSGESGLRSYGHGHRIINNYFGGLTGSGSLTPLVIGSGTVEQDLTRSNSEHSRSKDVLVAFNTFYNNQGTYLRIGEDFRSLPPQNISVAHNILTGSSGTLVFYDEGENVTWTKNILFGSAGKGNVPSTGYTFSDPKMVARAGGIYGVSSSSPAINQASATSYPAVTSDMDGQARAGMKDTGADEFSTDPVKTGPLTSANVGPSSA